MGILEHLHEARADLQDRVCELLEERDELTKERDMASSRVQALRSTIHRLIDDNEALEAERDDLEARLRQTQEFADDTQAEFNRLNLEIVRLSGLPRMITADELREGQLICIHRWHGWGVRAIGEFQGIEGDVVTIKTGGSGTFTESVKFHTIVLLVAEPAKDVYIPGPTLKENGEKFTRLAVDDLDAAEVGSVLSAPTGEYVRKGDDGLWLGIPSAVVVKWTGWTLTRPEKPEPVTWEDLRREKRWPTPNHMRRAADSIEQLTAPDYAGVLRYVADLCDNDARIVVEGEE